MYEHVRSARENAATPNRPPASPAGTEKSSVGSGR
jgi:hypothetical protein